MGFRGLALMPTLERERERDVLIPALDRGSGREARREGEHESCACTSVVFEIEGLGFEIEGLNGFQMRVLGFFN